MQEWSKKSLVWVTRRRVNGLCYSRVITKWFKLQQYLTIEGADFELV